LKIVKKKSPLCTLSNTNFFHATKPFLFSKKEKKSNLCTNLYHDLKKRNEKANKLKNLEKKLKRKQNIFVRLERKN